MCHPSRHHSRRPRAATRHDPDVRISDADREQAVTRLGEQAAEGRLSAEELDERTDAVLAARTHGELEPLFADLPRARPAAQSAHRDRDELREHLVAFVLVNLLLIGIWAATGAGYFWPIWPLLGWGVGVLSHAGGVHASRSGGRGSRAYG